MEKSRLLTPDITLNIGDLLLETDADNENNYRIYKITSIDDNYMKLWLKFEVFHGKIVDHLQSYRTIVVGADLSAHYYTEGDTIKTYILGKNHPYRILYEENKE